MTDLRQAPQYTQFMKDLGWKVEKVGRWNAYIREFPIIGSFIKIQKISSPIPFDVIKQLKNKYKIVKFQVAPDLLYIDKTYYKCFIEQGFQIDNSPNIPTQTIQIDLTQSKNNLFNKFSEAKRRAVRRAIKNGVVVKESNDIQSFINIRKRQHFPMGFLFVKEMRMLWKNFYPSNAILLLAYTKGNKPIAGIFLLFYDQVAYYWYASATSEGKKLFAPTLLVWEAMKLAKKRKCRIFDFEGIYDDRFPRATNTWKGFTKFKEGFGGNEVQYIGSFIR